jgi:hypothetical protein
VSSLPKLEIFEDHKDHNDEDAENEEAFEDLLHKFLLSDERRGARRW